MINYGTSYTHISRHNPLALSRSQARERIRLIGASAKFKDVTVEDLVLLPAKPPKKVRKSKKRETCKDLSLLDGEFVEFGTSVTPDLAGEDNLQGGTNPPTDEDSNIDPNLDSESNINDDFTERLGFTGDIEAGFDGE